MIQVLTILHVVISVFLVVLILLQFGRGAEAGFFSDTSSQGVFAGPGPTNILVRATTFLAILFLALALYLAHLRGNYQRSSVFDKGVPQALDGGGQQPLQPGGAGKNALDSSSTKQAVPVLPESSRDPEPSKKVVPKASQKAGAGGKKTP